MTAPVPIRGPESPTLDRNVAQALYERVCESYHAVDDFRMKLLGLLPVATGTGVFLLLNVSTDLSSTAKTEMADVLLAIGLFGLLVTCGLFAYELFGIKKCHYLIVTGQRLEKDLGGPGQFNSRPRELAGLINEPFASSIIYPASVAAWVYLGLTLTSALAAGVSAVAIFAFGCGATLFLTDRIKSEQLQEDRILELIRDNAPMSLAEVSQALAGRTSAAPALPDTRWARRLANRPDRTTNRLTRQRLLEEGDDERVRLTAEGELRVGRGCVTTEMPPPQRVIPDRTERAIARGPGALDLVLGCTGVNVFNQRRWPRGDTGDGSDSRHAVLVARRGCTDGPKEGTWTGRTGPGRCRLDLRDAVQAAVGARLTWPVPAPTGEAARLGRGRPRTSPSVDRAHLRSPGGCGGDSVSGHSPGEGGGAILPVRWRRRSWR